MPAGWAARAAEDFINIELSSLWKVAGQVGRGENRVGQRPRSLSQNGHDPGPDSSLTLKSDDSRMPQCSFILKIMSVPLLRRSRVYFAFKTGVFVLPDTSADRYSSGSATTPSFPEVKDLAAPILCPGSPLASIRLIPSRSIPPPMEAGLAKARMASAVRAC